MIFCLLIYNFSLCNIVAYGNAYACKTYKFIRKLASWFHSKVMCGQCSIEILLTLKSSGEAW